MQPLEATWEVSNTMWLEDSSSFPWPATQIMTLHYTTEHHHWNGPLYFHLNSQQTMPLYPPPQSSITILLPFTPFPHLFLLRCKRWCINSLLNCMINIFLHGSDHDLLVFAHNSCSFLPFIFSSKTTSRNILWVSDNTNLPHCHRKSKLMYSFLNTFMGYRLLWEMRAAESPLLLNSKEALELAWNHPGN